MNFDIRRDDPAVSVCLITYNHEDYIRECLDGILMQETQFPFELVLGEDESTDATRSICVEYAEKNPDRIKLILRKQSDPGRDVYTSQGVYNYIETTKACRGKYLALCDGDDLWLDPFKLQKQFNIMEADPRVSLVHSDYDSLDQLSGHRVKNANRKKCCRYSHEGDHAKLIYDIIQRNYPIISSTVFMRTHDALDIFDNSLDLFTACPMGDVITWSELANYGSFHYQNESHVLYRILAESDSNSQSAKKKFKFVNEASNFGLMIGEKYHLPMNKLRRIKVKNCNRFALATGTRTEIQRLYEDKDYPFSISEFGVYHAGRIIGVRGICKWLFQLRYREKRFLQAASFFTLF